MKMLKIITKIVLLFVCLGHCAALPPTFGSMKLVSNDDDPLQNYNGNSEHKNIIKKVAPLRQGDRAKAIHKIHEKCHNSVKQQLKSSKSLAKVAKDQFMEAEWKIYFHNKTYRSGTEWAAFHKCLDLNLKLTDPELTISALDDTNTNSTDLTAIEDYDEEANTETADPNEDLTAEEKEARLKLFLQSLQRMFLKLHSTSGDATQDKKLDPATKILVIVIVSLILMSLVAPLVLYRINYFIKSRRRIPYRRHVDDVTDIPMENLHFSV